MSVRQSAPTDGRDPFTNWENKQAFSTSKQNSDAMGYFYQWGRKDPYTFATNSQQWGNGDQRGQFPVKIYTIDGVLIYQEYNGDINTDKQPVGGVIISSASATSMMETIKNPINYYDVIWPNVTVIDQVGKTTDLYNYYWSSYSRGVDGKSTWNASLINDQNWHNNYLNGYISQRSKSIYDPCPYGFRIQSNGTFNDTSRQSWVSSSYSSGYKWNISANYTWLSMSGNRSPLFYRVGAETNYTTSLPSTYYACYSYSLIFSNIMYASLNSYRSTGFSVRCIDFA